MFLALWKGLVASFRSGYFFLILDVFAIDSIAWNRQFGKCQFLSDPTRACALRTFVDGRGGFSGPPRSAVPFDDIAIERAAIDGPIDYAHLMSSQAFGAPN